MTDSKIRMQEMFADREKIGEVLYLIFFVLAVGTRAVGVDETVLIFGRIPLFMAVLAGCAFLFLCKLFVTKHTVKEYVIIAAFMLLAGLVYINTGSEKGLILDFMMMLGMKKVSSKKVIGYGALIAGSLILIKIFIGIFGFTSEIYYPQYREGVGVMFRHALGYAHPNTLHMNVIMLTMMAIYLITVFLKDRENGKILLLIASLAAFLFNLYIFQYSGSRTGVLACFAYLIVNYYLYIRKSLGLFEKIVSYAALPLTAFTAIVLPLILPENLFLLLNRTLFNSRFEIAKYYWSNNGISLFGRQLNNPVEKYKTYGLDMAQLYLFLQLGVITFIVVSVLTIFFINRCIVKDKRAELAVMLAMLFVGIWEPLLYNISAKNFTFVFMGAALYSFMEKYEQEKEPEKVRDFTTDKAYVMLILKHIVAGVAFGIVAAVIFVAVTKEPTALYGAREESESGESFGMEPGYYTKEQIADFKKNGDIVIDYSGEDHPMYRYDESIAVMEYHKKILSVGAWTGIMAFSACQIIGAKRKKSCYNGSV